MKTLFIFSLLFLVGCSARPLASSTAPVRSSPLTVPGDNTVGVQDNATVKTSMFYFSSPCDGFLNVELSTLAGTPERHWEWIKQDSGEELAQYVFDGSTLEKTVQFTLRRGVPYILRLTLTGDENSNATFATAYQSCT